MSELIFFCGKTSAASPPPPLFCYRLDLIILFRMTSFFLQKDVYILKFTRAK